MSDWIVLLLGMSVIAFFALMYVRIHLVHIYRLRAIDIMYSGPYCRHMNAKYRLNNPSYNQMVFDLTRWTFKSFYPDLAD